MLSSGPGIPESTLVCLLHDSEPNVAGAEKVEDVDVQVQLRAAAVLLLPPTALASSRVVSHEAVACVLPATVAPLPEVL